MMMMVWDTSWSGGGRFRDTVQKHCIIHMIVQKLEQQLRGAKHPQSLVRVNQLNDMLCVYLE